MTAWIKGELILDWFRNYDFAMAISKAISFAIEKLLLPVSAVFMASENVPVEWRTHTGIDSIKAFTIAKAHVDSKSKHVGASNLCPKCLESMVGFVPLFDNRLVAFELLRMFVETLTNFFIESFRILGAIALFAVAIWLVPPNLTPQQRKALEAERKRKQEEWEEEKRRRRDEEEARQREARREEDEFKRRELALLQLDLRNEADADRLYDFNPNDSRPLSSPDTSDKYLQQAEFDYANSFKLQEQHAASVKAQREFELRREIQDRKYRISGLKQEFDEARRRGDERAADALKYEIRDLDNQNHATENTIWRL